MGRRHLRLLRTWLCGCVNIWGQRVYNNICCGESLCRNLFECGFLRHSAVAACLMTAHCG